jgi:non-ribosomal peptide synthetase component F
MYVRASAALYEGDGIAAHAEVEGSWAALDRSLLLRLTAARVESLYLRGLCAAAAAAQEGARPLRVAERAERTLAREDATFARPFRHALAAGIARVRGQQEERAAALYEEAERGFGELGMGLHAASARMRRGEILRGDEGRALWEVGEAWLRDHGMIRPDRTAAMLLPG